MMIVNGAPQNNDLVWGQSVALTAGVTYEFTVYARSTYDANPGNLGFGFAAGDSSLGSLQLGAISNGWAQFHTFFTAGAQSQVGVTDLIVIRDGNDFVLDDISLTAVPEPTTIIIWSLLGGLGLVFAWRKRKST